MGGEPPHQKDTWGISTQGEYPYYGLTSLEFSRWGLGVPPPEEGNGEGRIGGGGCTNNLETENYRKIYCDAADYVAV